MKKYFIKIRNSQIGFTLVETLTYLFIFTMLFLVISSMVISIFNIRKQIQASYYVHENARFIAHFLENRVHNVDLIDNLGISSEQIHFYNWPDTRFNLGLESDNLIYREVHDIGQGFPDQASSTPVVLNNNNIRVSDLTIEPIDLSEGLSNRGAKIGFVLTIGQSSDIYGYLSKEFNIFIALR